MSISISKKSVEIYARRMARSPICFTAAAPSAPPAAIPSRYLSILSAKIDLGEKVLYRDEQINQLIRVLEKRKENSPVLVGEPGVGKTAIVEELARRIASNNLVMPDSCGRVCFNRNTRIVSLDLGGLQSLRARPLDLDAELKTIIGFIESEEKNGNKIVVWIDEIHLLPGEFSRLDQYLKEATGKGNLQIIGATTEVEYRQTFERDPALARRFPSILVNPLSCEQTLQLLQSIYLYYEKVHHVRLQSKALLGKVVELAEKHLPGRVLPGSAITLLDHALAAVAKRQEMIANSLIGRKKVILSLLEDLQLRGTSAELERKINTLVEETMALNDRLSEEAGQKEKTVTIEDVYQAAAEISRHDLTSIRNGSGRENLLQLPSRLKAVVIGQDPAIDAICRHIAAAKTGLKEDKKPVCSVMLLGQTGVGKTEIARQLAKQLFGEEKAMLRFDMSEFQEAHTVSRFLGSPHGYVGSQEGGELINAVRKNPETIILLDEIEKAHPDIHRMLLGVLEDGIATSRTEAKARFNRAIIIMTSNARSELLKTFHFPPEFLNRLDEIVQCQSLNEEQMRMIAQLRLKELEKRMEQQGYVLEWTEKAAAFLASTGFSEEYGARPLKRVIKREIESAISAMILEAPQRELSPQERVRFTIGANGGGLSIMEDIVVVPKPANPRLNPQTENLLRRMKDFENKDLTIDDLDEMIGISRLPEYLSIELVNPPCPPFEVKSMNPWLADPVMDKAKENLQKYVAEFGVSDAAAKAAARWVEVYASKALTANLDSYLRKQFGHSLEALMNDRAKLKTMIAEASGKKVEITFAQESDEGLVVYVSNESRMSGREKLAMDIMLELKPASEEAAIEAYQASLDRGIELDLNLLSALADINAAGLRMFYQRAEGKTAYVLKIPAPRVSVGSDRVAIHDNDPERETGIKDVETALNPLLTVLNRQPERRTLLSDWLSTFIQKAKQGNAPSVLPATWDAVRSKAVEVSWTVEDGELKIGISFQSKLPERLKYLELGPLSDHSLAAAYERDEENVSLTDLILLQKLKEAGFVTHLNAGDRSTLFSLAYRIAPKKGDPEKLDKALMGMRIDIPQRDIPALSNILTGRENPDGAEELRSQVVMQLLQNFRSLDYAPYRNGILDALLEIEIPAALFGRMRETLAFSIDADDRKRTAVIKKLEEAEKYV